MLTDDYLANAGLNKIQIESIKGIASVSGNVAVFEGLNKKKTSSMSGSAADIAAKKKAEDDTKKTEQKRSEDIAKRIKLNNENTRKNWWREIIDYGKQHHMKPETIRAKLREFSKRTGSLRSNGMALPADEEAKKFLRIVPEDKYGELDNWGAPVNSLDVTNQVSSSVPNFTSINTDDDSLGSDAVTDSRGNELDNNVLSEDRTQEELDAINETNPDVFDDNAAGSDEINFLVKLFQSLVAEVNINCGTNLDIGLVTKKNVSALFRAALTDEADELSNEIVEALTHIDEKKVNVLFAKLFTYANMTDIPDKIKDAINNKMSVVYPKIRMYTNEQSSNWNIPNIGFDKLTLDKDVSSMSASDIRTIIDGGIEDYEEKPNSENELAELLGTDAEPSRNRINDIKKKYLDSLKKIRETNLNDTAGIDDDDEQHDLDSLVDEQQQQDEQETIDNEDESFRYANGILGED